MQSQRSSPIVADAPDSSLPLQQRMAPLIQKMLEPTCRLYTDPLTPAEEEFCSLLYPLDVSGFLHFGLIHIVVARGKIEIIKVEKTLKRPSR